jgi:hypothetical protein
VEAVVSLERGNPGILTPIKLAPKENNQKLKSIRRVDGI